MAQIIDVDYNSLSAAKKAKVEHYKVRFSNHPDFPAGMVWELDIPKDLFTILNS